MTQTKIIIAITIIVLIILGVSYYGSYQHGRNVERAEWIERLQNAKPDTVIKRDTIRVVIEKQVIQGVSLPLPDSIKSIIRDLRGQNDSLVALAEHLATPFELSYEDKYQTTRILVDPWRKIAEYKPEYHIPIERVEVIYPPVAIPAPEASVWERATPYLIGAIGGAGAVALLVLI